MALTYRGQLDRPLTTEEIDGNFAYFTGSHGITGSIGISGSIIPAVGVGETTSSFSLGSPTAAWKDIYASEGSIKFVKSGSEEVVLSAKDGGIQVNGGPTISADGINGQFFTSKSLDTNITVKDSNNSLLMGPIDVEEDNETVFDVALRFLNSFSDYSRFIFYFDQKLEKPSCFHLGFQKLHTESGGNISFTENKFETHSPSSNEVVLGIFKVKDIEKDWDLKIIGEIQNKKNPLHVLNFKDDGLGSIRIKEGFNLWD